MTSMNGGGKGTIGASGGRGLSEVIGVVLLFGLVAASIGMILAVSGAATDQVITHQRFTVAQKATVDMQSDLATIADKGEMRRTSVDLATGGRTTVASEDRLSITVNGSKVCSVSLDLSRVRYRTKSGRSLVYQAGAVWKHTDSGVTAVSMPSVTFENGSLDVSLVDVEGDGADETFEVVENPSRSNRRTLSVSRDLFDRWRCQRPESIRLTVVSEDYHRQWYQYLSAEMPESSEVMSNPSSGRVTVLLDQEELPKRADDRRNRVVNLSDGRQFNGWVDESTDKLAIDKGVDQRYQLTATLLAAQAGRESALFSQETRYYRVEKSTRQWKALDVAFVVDESCSMNSNNCPEKGNAASTQIAEAKDATRKLIDTLQRDRFKHGAGIVAFPGDVDGTASDPKDGGSPADVYRPISEDLSKVKSTVSEMGDLDYSTPTDDGIQAGAKILKNGNKSHKKVMVVITDGKPTDNGKGWKKAAKAAAKRGVYIHAIGFGPKSAVDQSMVKSLAKVSGGEYHYAKTESGLEDIFREIYKEANKTVRKSYQVPTLNERVIKHPVVRMRMQTGSQGLFNPWTRKSDIVSLSSPTVQGTTEAITIEDGDGLSFVGLQRRKCNNYQKTSITESYPGSYKDLKVKGYKHPKSGKRKVDDSWKSKSFTHYACTDPGAPAGQVPDATIYTDGDSVPSFGSTWWQDGLASKIPDEYTESGRFDLRDNQLVVLYSGGSRNSKALFLVEVGNAPANSYTKGLVNVGIADVRLEDD